MKLFFPKAKWVLTHIQKLRDFAARNFYKDAESNRAIRNSAFFDEAYYKRNNPDLSSSINLLAHYINYGGTERRDPSEYFCNEEYFSINPDLAEPGTNPLSNYETRDPKDMRMFSTLQAEREDHFPQGTQTISIVQDPAHPVHKRTAVVSCYFHDGKIPDSLMILIRGLKEIADNLILVGDCPVFPSELEKIKNFVCYAHFERHNQYDFGSYKIGFNYARKAGLLKADTADELILINDSCYGPAYPFSELFQRMESVICDFWGINGSKNPPQNIFKPHISSFFYVFRRSVLNENDIDDFLNAIHGKYDRTKVICLLELEFTQYLQRKGFIWPVTEKKGEHSIYLHPLTFLETYRIPLVKKKALKGNSEEILNKILSIISDNCPEMIPCIQLTNPPPEYFKPPSIAEHQKSIPEKIRKISAKMRRGEKLKTIFLTTRYSARFARIMLEQMLTDPAFDPYIAIIPDFSEKNNFIMDAASEILTQEKDILSAGVPENTLIPIRPDELERWPDVCNQMDLVWYSTPKNISSFRYQPKYAAGSNFLPLMLIDHKTDGYNDPDTLGLDGCRYMWKLFFTEETSLTLYKKHCVDGGGNGELLICGKEDTSIDEELLHRLKDSLNLPDLEISEEK